MVLEIIVTKRPGDYHAALKGDPCTWGCGPSENAAIGDLVRSHCVTFGIAIEICIPPLSHNDVKKLLEHSLYGKFSCPTCPGQYKTVPQPTHREMTPERLLMYVAHHVVDDGYTYTISGGDLSTACQHYNFLKARGFDIGFNDVYPAFRSREDKEKALHLLYDNNIAGWWCYRGDLVEYGVCTEDGFKAKLTERKGKIS